MTLPNMNGYWLSFLWIAQWALLARAVNFGLVERATASSSPSPISVPPSQNWDGNDGPWSSFTLLAGIPAQNVRVLVSTSSSNTWLVRSDGCPASDSTCVENRGRTFNPNSSSTWQQHGYYQLGEGQSLGVQAQGLFGNDTVGLGIQGSGGPILPNQIIAAYTSTSLYLGMFGTNPSPTNFSATDRGRPSFLGTLKSQSLIPSLSVGYTAGNQYRLKQVFGSLTLGGYDSSKFTPNSLSMNFSTDFERSLMVGIQTIHAEDKNGTTSDLLPNGIMANVDPTFPLIWLPLDACQAFEKAFGLAWDDKTELYLVDDNLHNALKAQNASITFQLGAATIGGQTVNITLPYASFDLLVKSPAFGISSSQRYFPLRRAANDTQTSLGRTFLQEAYLTVDYERRNFSISQCLFSQTAPQNLVPINSTSSSNGSGSSSNGKTIGIAVGVSAGAVAIIGAIVAYLFLRRRRRLEEQKAKERGDSAELIRQGFSKGELDTGNDNQRFEIAESGPNFKKEVPLPVWQDEKAKYPGSRHGMAEADGGDVSVPELGTRRTYAKPIHEMYDPSTHPVELPADQPRGELHGSTAAGSSRNSRVSSRRSGIRSLFGNSASPLSRISRPSPVNRQSGRTPQSPSSLYSPSIPSPAPSPLPHPSRGIASPDRSMAPSPPAKDMFGPVSRQNTFDQLDRSGSPSSERGNEIWSPISPESPQAGRGLFERMGER